jgi:hypothetical protein
MVALADVLDGALDRLPLIRPFRYGDKLIARPAQELPWTGAEFSRKSRLGWTPWNLERLKTAPKPSPKSIAIPDTSRVAFALDCRKGKDRERTRMLAIVTPETPL